jgi:hypothetical protein
MNISLLPQDIETCTSTTDTVGVLSMASHPPTSNKKLTIETLSHSRFNLHQFLPHSLFFIAMCYLFAIPVYTASKSEGEIEMARDRFFDCQVKHLQTIDNKQSDVNVVALNLTNLCLDEYKALNKIVAQHSLDTSNERRMFTIDRNADYSKIDASLPLVNMNR